MKFRLSKMKVITQITKTFMRGNNHQALEINTLHFYICLMYILSAQTKMYHYSSLYRSSYIIAIFIYLITTYHDVLRQLLKIIFPIIQLHHYLQYFRKLADIPSPLSPLINLYQGSITYIMDGWGTEASAILFDSVLKYTMNTNHLNENNAVLLNCHPVSTRKWGGWGIIS